VKKAVGIERDRERYHVCADRLKTRRIAPSRGSVILDDFDKVLQRRVKGVTLGEATVVFYGLSNDKVLLRRVQRHLRKGARLIYWYSCLFPEILPDRVRFPFYVSVCAISGVQGLNTNGSQQWSGKNNLQLCQESVLLLMSCGTSSYMITTSTEFETELRNTRSD